MVKIKIKNLLENRDFLELFSDPLYIVDKNKHFIYYNYAFLNLFNFNFRDLKENNLCHEYIQMSICNDSCLVDKCLATGKILTLREIETYDREGNFLSLWLNAYPLYDEEDKPAAVLVILRDMTAENEIHNKFKILYEKEKQAKIILEETVKERTEQLRQANLELKLLNNKLKEVSIRDGLTGIFNYRYFYSQLELFFKEAKEKNKELSCLLIDIDHFKSINDNHNHLFGDFVLSRAVEIFKDVFDDAQQILARYGGDEFVLLLPESGYDKAKDLAQRVREKISQTLFKNEYFSTKITLSIGITSIPYDQKNMRTKEDLIKFADQALYEAKASGRNKVVCFKDIYYKVLI
ncbi:MAG: GGDEF domain-containing protein [Candidatus Omnitrophica bacterium]|nr:GGDEF domain-containing protein [Candidatus Omnitrophota bacterium]